MRSTRDQTSGATLTEAHRIEATCARAGVVSAVLVTSVANRGTSLVNAAARRVRIIHAVRETDGAAGEPHRTPRGDQSFRRCVRITSTYSLSRK
ncbi:hypothetical protein MTO96_027562 [Rhipicephalus appendiculatus]